MNGRVVQALTDKINSSKGEFTIVWDDIDLDAGVYLIRITLADKVVNKKVIHISG